MRKSFTRIASDLTSSLLLSILILSTVGCVDAECLFSSRGGNDCAAALCTLPDHHGTTESSTGHSADDACTCVCHSLYSPQLADPGFVDMRVQSLGFEKMLFPPSPPFRPIDHPPAVC